MINVNFTWKQRNHHSFQFCSGGDSIKQPNAHVHLGLHFQADDTWPHHAYNKYTLYMKRHVTGLIYLDYWNIL